MTRTSTVVRRIDGAIVGPSSRLSRTVSPESSTGSIKSFVASTPELSSGEINVARAYYILFGRVPDVSGLAYWSGVLGGASVAVAVDTIVSALSGSYILDTDPAASIALVYHHLLGKVKEEDISGQAYWTSVLEGGTSLGTVASQLISAALSLSGYYADQIRNRLLTLESICRVQKDEAYSLNMQDSRSIMLRVVGKESSYDAAMDDVQRLLVDRVASSPLTWGQSHDADSFFASTRLVDNSSIRQNRYLVWYNRSGQMMLANAYVPPNFASVAQHRCIIAMHGGGWRQGYPEKLYTYCEALAQGTDPSYVVLSPTYRLTTYGFYAPMLEQDIEDFYSLVCSSSFLKIYANKVGLFGESSGGHLACLVGSKQNIPRVMAMYPPIDLTGSIAVSSGLNPYVDYYASGAQQAASSPNLVWTPGCTTRFQLWHGLADTFVPSTQTAAMVTAAGTNCVARYRTGEGHGFTQAVRNEVLSAARRFFDDRQVLDS